MTRPFKMRQVGLLPGTRAFKPSGVPMRMLRELYLSLDGLEAMRLVDLEGLSQADAAARMGVSRQTLGRALAVARRTVVRALVEGMAIRVEDDIHHMLVSGPDDQGTGRDDPIDTTRREWIMMIAVGASGADLEAMVDPHFGRARAFLIVHPDTWEFRCLDNEQGMALSHGSGIAAAERVAKEGAGVVLAGSVGPKAFDALMAAGIAVAIGTEGMTVREAVTAFREGRLKVARRPSDPRGTR